MRSRSGAVAILVAALTMPGCGVTGGRGDRVRVSVTVHGCDGRPPARAYARRIFHDEGAGVLAEGTGRLVFDLRAPGFHWIRVGAVNHRDLEIPLLLERDRSLRFDVRLEMPDVPRAPAAVAALGTFNGFSGTEGTIPLVRQPDGTWSATLPKAPREVAYLLTGAPGWWQIPGTDADAYRLVDSLDGRGGYVSILRSTDATERITFDRDRLPACTGGFEAQFGDATGRTARFAQAYLGVRRRERVYFTALHAHEEAGGATEDFLDEMLPVAAEMAALAAVETDDVVRHTLELQSAGWLPDGHLDAERAVRVLETVPADAPGWSLSMDVFRPVARRHPDRRAVEEYARRVVETHADGRVRSSVLMYLTQAAFADGRRTEAEGHYLRLLAEFPASPEAADARAMWGPDRSIQAGRRVPEFSFQALDRPGERITDRTLAGRRYLIDFWSTSCGPCLAHLPTLRTLQARHGGTGFTILSVSVDPEAEVVFGFRRKRPMPWMHAILGGGLTDPAARSFGVDGVPTYVLVGADGTIAAEPWEMLGDGLERTVDRVLGRRW